MVDFEAFGDFLRNAIRDIRGGGARDIIRPVERVGEDIGGAFGDLSRDIRGGGARDIFSGLRRNIGDIGSRIREDVSGGLSGLRRDLSGFADFLRRHKLAIGLGAGLGLAGLGAYEFLRSQGGNNYNTQLGGAGLLGGAGQCDPTCGQIPELPPCPQCSQGGAGTGQCDPTCGQIPELPPCPQCGGSGLGGGLGGGSIFSDPLVWIIIAVVVIIIIVIIIYYSKKKKKG